MTPAGVTVLPRQSDQPCQLLRQILAGDYGGVHGDKSAAAGQVFLEVLELLPASRMHDRGLVQPLHDIEQLIVVLGLDDELVYEIKKEHVEEALPLIKETMEAAIKLCIPIIVDIGVGDNYAEAKI